MERGSSKHSPRLDDQLKHETIDVTHGAGVPSRSRDDQQQEPMDDDARWAEAGARPDVAEPDGALPVDEVAQRAELARHLAVLAWPATTDDIIAAVTAGGAEDVTMERLARLPVGWTFDSVQEVWTAAGGGAEAHR